MLTYLVHGSPLRPLSIPPGPLSIPPLSSFRGSAFGSRQCEIEGVRRDSVSALPLRSDANCCERWSKEHNEWALIRSPTRTKAALTRSRSRHSLQAVGWVTTAAAHMMAGSPLATLPSLR